MQREIVYPGQILPETTLLQMATDSLVGVSKLAEAILGNGPVLSGLACTPTAPASLSVNIGPGQIYAVAPLDASAFSSLPADTTHQVVKQGLLLDGISLNCPAPSGSGQSICYLVQIAFQEQDRNPVMLPYYNASNPAQAWTGPNNNSQAQNTQRAGMCIVSVKAGAAAATGLQQSPAVDAGCVPAWVVTVASGQSVIATANIAQAPSAPFIGNTLTMLAPLASPVLSGTPTAPTPAQLDNSTRLATTAFVQKGSGRVVGVVNISAATTLTMVQLGSLLTLTGSSAYSIGLPAAAVAPNGCGYRLVNGGSSVITLQAASGDGITYGALTTSTVLLAPGDTFELYSNGSNAWFAADSTLLGSAGSLAGQVSYFARNTPPAGWLAADGAAVSRSTYAALYAAIATTFGTGDGVSTFNLPDLRGEFIRGWDNGRGVDVGRAFASAQASAVGPHTHPAKQGYLEVGNYDGGGNDFFSPDIKPGAATNIDQNSGSGSANESRPRNLALLACIRF